jgi:hypothetical protein
MTTRSRSRSFAFASFAIASLAACSAPLDDYGGSAWTSCTLDGRAGFEITIGDAACGVDGVERGTIYLQLEPRTELPASTVITMDAEPGGDDVSARFATDSGMTEAVSGNVEVEGLGEDVLHVDWEFVLEDGTTARGSAAIEYCGDSGDIC